MRRTQSQFVFHLLKTIMFLPPPSLFLFYFNRGATAPYHRLVQRALREKQFGKQNKKNKGGTAPVKEESKDATTVAEGGGGSSAANGGADSQF